MAPAATVGRNSGDFGHERAREVGEKKEEREGVRFHALPVAEEHRDDRILRRKMALAALFMGGCSVSASVPGAGSGGCHRGERSSWWCASRRGGGAGAAVLHRRRGSTGRDGGVLWRGNRRGRHGQGWQHPVVHELGQGRPAVHVKQGAWRWAEGRRARRLGAGGEGHDGCGCSADGTQGWRDWPCEQKVVWR
jgi:hypothetical protein